MDLGFLINGLSLQALFGVMLLLVGELVALLRWKNLIQFLIISSIAEIGFVLLGLGTGTYVGTSGALLHLEYQIVMRGLVFLAAAAFIFRGHSASVEKLQGIGRKMPVTTTLFGFGLFSVMGLSPFKGSISKFLIIYAAIESGHWLSAAIATFGSIIEAVYFLQVFQILCFEDPVQEGPGAEEVRETSPGLMAVLLVLGVLTALMGLIPEPFIHGAERAAAVLLGGTGPDQLPVFESPWSSLVLVPYVGGFIVYLAGCFSQALRNILAVGITGTTVYLTWLAGNFDSLSKFFALLMAFIGFLVTLYSVGYFKAKPYANRYFFFLLLMLGTLLGLTTSKELGNFYVFWELMTWTSYFLVIQEQTQKALRAGFKYFIMCTSGAYIMLLAILTLHVKLGSLDLTTISANLQVLSPGLMLVVLGMFIIGFGVKAGLVPLHSWLPDAHPVAPSSISAPMSGILTKTGIYGLVRILFVVFGVSLLTKVGTTGQFSTIGFIISLLGAFTLLYGEIMALLQTDVKKMLAYSTMAQVGEIVITLGVGTYLSFIGALYHILNHAIMKNLLFLAVGALILRVKSQEINKLKGIGRVMPVTSLCFSIGILAIMGLPPFNGFISKFLMLYALVQSGHLALAGLILLGSILGGFYYLKVVRIIFFEKYEGPARQEAPITMLIPIVILTGLSIFNGVYPQAGLALIKPVADLIAANGHMAVTAIPKITISWPIVTLIPMVGALFAYFFGRRSVKVSGWLAVATMVATLATVFAASTGLDIFSRSFAFLIAFIGVLNLLYSLGYMEHEHAQNRFYLFFTLMIGGLLGVAVSKDLFNFFAFWEIMSSWTLYFVIIHEETSEALREGFKYFIFNYVGANLLLLGLLVLTVNAGTFEMSELAGRLSALPTGLVALGLILMLIGFAMKAAMLPFRIDYQMHPPTAPTPVSGYISSVLLKSAPFGMVKLFYVFGGVALLSKLGQLGDMPSLMYILAWVSGLTILMAAALALLQSGMKRLLIYHTVSQMGYIILGISLGSSLGLAGGLLHLVNHMLFKNLLFLVAGAIMVKTGIGDLDRLGGIGRKMPVTLSVFAIGTFSIAGIPPFNGFTSKWLIYEASMEKGYVFLALLSLLASVLTLASFLKFLHSAFFGQIPKELENVTEAPWTMQIPMVILAVLCMVFGIFPGIPLATIAAIERSLGLTPVSVTLFGIDSGLGTWNAGIIAVFMVIAFIVGLSIYFVGNGKIRYTKIYTCGVTTLTPEEVHVNSHNLYESPKGLIKGWIKFLHRVAGLGKGV
ncbi:proton-conducting transporter membrane subunit [Carboxydothermus hydrogenoformans]|uniref:Carbon monoxide-induced hydrogenase, membrane anchor subunit n=1 Tax=Carboxydothermus hydrogenoformans (strain ATCC BAA-161 / DSM 6008 / Z-2901) TaxID=246194 RepID=Q3AB32_CARHZ|nr:proton-conducting transporter membrane subunit [Carboxydothermus hydrogenoformans]ABB14956.1 carbon monoxide-induced hydrogenase, membrane anchor subunit [Carboxydothermus hydrogenoformans Z-2901]